MLPAPVTVILLPLIVPGAEITEYAIGNPELADALSVIGATPKVTALGCGNVIVCAIPWITAMDCPRTVIWAVRAFPVVARAEA